MWFNCKSSSNSNSLEFSAKQLTPSLSYTYCGNRPTLGNGALPDIPIAWQVYADGVGSPIPKAENF